MGTFSTILAILSTIIGGGIVSVPWAFLQLGFYASIFMLAFTVLQALLGSVLYLKARDFSPANPKSMYDMGYQLLGRASIFWISTITVVISFGLLIIYLSVFGDIAKTIFTNMFLKDDSLSQSSYGTKRSTYVILISVLITPFIMKKQMAELHIVSMTLFTACIMFVLMNIFEAAFVDKVHHPLNNFIMPKEDANTAKIVQSISIITTACNFLTNLLPLYTNQKDKSTGKLMKSVTYSLLLTSLIYIGLAAATIYMYGVNLNQNILVNIG